MTYREKLMQEHPDRVSEIYAGGCEGCPSDYGYNAVRPCWFSTGKECRACWDQEMPTAAEAGKENDPVSHPAHYTSGGIECIDAIEAALSCHSNADEAFLTGQVLKYMWRWPLKNGVEDLHKARWYLDRLIGKVEGK